MANGQLSPEELRRMLMLMYGQGIGAPPVLPQEQGPQQPDLGSLFGTPINQFQAPQPQPSQQPAGAPMGEFAFPFPWGYQDIRRPFGGTPEAFRGGQAEKALPISPYGIGQRVAESTQPHLPSQAPTPYGLGAMAAKRYGEYTPWLPKQAAIKMGEGVNAAAGAIESIPRVVGEMAGPTAELLTSPEPAGTLGKMAMQSTSKKRMPSVAEKRAPGLSAGEMADQARESIASPTLEKPKAEQAIQEAVKEYTGSEKLPPKPVLDHLRENPDSFVSMLKSIFVGETKQERKIKFLENLRDIAEGMGNIRAYTAADLRVGLGPGSQPPFIAEGFRTQIAREEDKFTPEEAQTFATAFGMKPEQLVGQSKSSFAKFMPGMVGQQRLQAAGANKVTSNIMAATRDFRGKAKPLKEKYVLDSQALRALDSNNWNGDASAANTMIRSSGDNRITEYDFKRHTTRPGLWDSINDWLEKKLTSRLPEDIRQGMREVAEGVRKEMQLRVDEEAKFAAHNYSGLAGSEEELRQRFQTTFDEYGAGPDGEMVEMITPKGDVIQVHRSRVEDAKAAGAMEK